MGQDAATTVRPGTRRPGRTEAILDATYELLVEVGYDRLTVEFNNGQPGSIEIRPQANTKFVTDPKGDTVTLAGQVGLKVVIHSADAHTAYSGSTDMKTGYAGIKEVRQLGDFEGYVSYGLGLAKPGCYTAVILTNPTRLVIDIQVN